MPDITEGLLNRWQLLANAIDSAGSAHLTNNNSVTFSTENGALFNGTNQYLSGTVPRSTSAWTLSMWIKPTAIVTTATQHICCGTGVTFGFAVLSSNSFYIMFENTNNTYNLTVTSEYTAAKFPTSAFTHVLATHDRTAKIGKYYRNGTLVATKNPTVPGTSVTNFSLGAPQSASTFWGGNIKDVRHYSRVLSDAEIATLASNGPNGVSGGQTAPTTGVRLTSRQPLAATLSTFPATLTRGFRV